MKVDKQYLFAFLLACGYAAYRLIPAVFTGFATADDAEFFLHAHLSDLSQVATIYAHHQGRFYHLFILPLYSIVYLAGGITGAKIINIILLFLCFIVLGFSMIIITGNRFYAPLIILLCAAFIPFNGANNPVMSYPGIFTGSFLILLCGILALLRYGLFSETRAYFWSLFFFTMAILFYEAYLMYLVVPFILIISFPEKMHSPTATIKRWLPFFISGILYLMIYFHFRYYHPSQYNGTRFSNTLSLPQITSVLIHLPAGALPLSFTGVIDDAWNMLPATGKVIRILIGLTAGGLFFVCLQRIPFLSWQRWSVVFFTSALCIFLPHIPLALSEKYLYQYNRFYISSFFSFFAVVILLTCILIALKRLLQRYYARLFAILATLLFSAGAGMCDIINLYASSDLQKPRQLFDCIDAFICSPVFADVPPDAVIYAPNIYTHTSSISYLFAQNFSWSDYFRYRSGKPVKIIRCFDEFKETVKYHNRRAYCLYNTYDTRMKNHIICFSAAGYNNLDTLTSHVLTDTVTLFAYGSASDILFTGQSSATCAEITSDKQKSVESSSRFTVSVPAGRNKGWIILTDLKHRIVVTAGMVQQAVNRE